MRFVACELGGAFVVELERREDSRGFFARAWCRREFAEHGLVTEIAQINTSLSKQRGTLRGLHRQLPPHGETKLVRCTAGALYDVIVDLRPDSPTFKRWIGIELSAANDRMLYVPAGFAHGFVTLTDDTVATYLVSEFYTPAAESGVRWDDPAFGIVWPVPIEAISDKDREWPDFAG